MLTLERAKELLKTSTTQEHLFLHAMNVSVAMGGMLKRHLAPQTLERLLVSELCADETQQQDNLAVRLRQKLQTMGKEERK